MSIFNKKDKEGLEKILVAIPDGMSYTDFIFKESNEEVGKVIGEIKKNRELIENIKQDMKELGETKEVLEIFYGLLEEEKELQNKKYIVENKYSPDSTLISLAGDIDIADNWNRGIEKIEEVIYKLTDIIGEINSIEKYFGGAYNSPYSVTLLKGINNIISQAASGYNNFNRKDKQELIMMFNKRYEEVIEEKNKKKLLDKYKK